MLTQAARLALPSLDTARPLKDTNEATALKTWATETGSQGSAGGGGGRAAGAQVGAARCRVEVLLGYGDRQ